MFSARDGEIVNQPEILYHSYRQRKDELVMRTKTLPFAAALLAFAFVATMAPAQTTSTAMVATASSATPSAIWKFDEFTKLIKKPVDWFSWGGDFRARNEYFNNALSLTTDPHLSPLFAPVHEQDYFRYRGRVWASFLPMDDLSLNIRLACEPREFMRPATMDTFFDESGMQWRYGIIDNLNVQWKRPLDLPATLTLGRQDIFLGDGWLMGDGSPEDGSFTYFVDAARLVYDLKDQQTTIDVIGLVEYARPDAILPTLGPSGSVTGDPEGLLLTDQNEKGAILWVANKSFAEANLDGYFMYKHDTRLNSPPPASFGDNADIYTLGGRVSGLLEDHWKYSAEGAYQFGRKQDPELNGQAGPNPLLAVQTQGFRDLRAFGVNSKLSYLFKDEMDNQLSLSFEYLTGDDPKSGNDEMFDVLWGRWPRWSEMYNIYSYVQESRVGQTANLIRFGPTWSLKPVKNMDFSASYFALFADQDVPTRDLNETLNPALGLPGSLGPFTGTGDFRGHYLQAVLKYKFTKNLTGHLWSEFLFPGDYYVSRGMVDFLRAELMVTF
jgi:hypothetical protein